MGMAIRFNDEWLSEPTFSDWLVKVSNDESRAYCRFCAIVLRAHKSDLTSHATTGKHVKNISNTANAPTGPISVQIIVDDNQPTTPAPGPGTSGYSSLYPGGPLSRSPQRIQYPKKYRVEWEQIEEFKDWLGPDPTDVSRATCKMCCVQLRAHKHDLLLHSKSSKHKKCQEEYVEGNYVTFDDSIPMQSSDGITEDTEIMDSQDQNGQPREGEDESGEGQAGAESASGSVPQIKTEQGAKRVAGNIVRVSAAGHRVITSFHRKRRRFTVNDVIDSIQQDHFTGYELLQICKAAIPKL